MMNYMYIIMLYMWTLFIYLLFIYFYLSTYRGLRVRFRIFSISSFRVKLEEMFVCDWEKSISQTT